MTMKKLLCALLCVLLAVSMSVAALAETYVKATTTVTIRKSASTSSKALGTMHKGDTLTYKGTTSDGHWYKVSYKGDTAYVRASYAKKTSNSGSSGEFSAGSYKYVKATSSSNVRKGAGLSYGSAGTIAKGEVVAYLGKSKEDSRGVVWHKVKFGGHTRWISEKYSKLTNSGSKSGSSYVTATTGSTYIREDYDKTSAIVATLGKGKTADYLGKSRKDDRGVKWYKVKYKGKTGWVSEKYSSLTK